jgi:glycosyltransferase involved in cell wall biosynthesis
MKNASPKLPIVSIVIPAYNSEKYIKAAIDSALAQTYPAIEVIVVDNGSSDRTGAIARSYGDKIVYSNHPGHSLAGGRNIGIEMSRGEFVALLDSDDLFLPEKIERQAKYLIANPQCGVSYCSVWHFQETDPNVMLTLKSDFYSGKEVFPHLLRKNFIIPLSVVFRKSAIMSVGLFDEHRRRSEDWEYWLRLSYHGVQFCYLPETLAKCRLHLGSAQQGSNGWEYKVKERKAALSVFRDLYLMMTSEERKRYGMRLIILENRLKLWYVTLGDYIPPLRWLLKWLQANRWARQPSDSVVK